MFRNISVCSVTEHPSPLREGLLRTVSGEKRVIAVFRSSLALKEIDDRIKSRYASGLVACNGKDLRLG